jgi:hypothetical protein
MLGVPIDDVVLSIDDLALTTDLAALSAQEGRVTANV